MLKFITQEFRESRVKLDILFKYNDKPNSYLQSVNNQLKFANGSEKQPTPQVYTQPKEHFKDTENDYPQYTNLQPVPGDRDVAEPELKYSKYKNYRIFGGSALFEDLQSKRKELKEVLATNPDDVHDVFESGAHYPLHRDPSGRASFGQGRFEGFPGVRQQHLRTSRHVPDLLGVDRAEQDTQRLR
jgi:hypothetical protein